MKLILLFSILASLFACSRPTWKSIYSEIDTEITKADAYKIASTVPRQPIGSKKTANLGIINNDTLWIVVSNKTIRNKHTTSGKNEFLRHFTKSTIRTIRIEINPNSGKIEKIYRYKWRSKYEQNKKTPRGGNFSKRKARILRRTIK